jgi:HK97 family phage prohead protease
MSLLFKDSGKVADVSKLDGIVVLYASAFGNKDAHGDIIMPGAYAKTIKEQGPGGANRIKHLWMHWYEDIIGKPLELIEDDIGLRVVSSISKTDLGRDALILYDEGVITEHSVGIGSVKRNEEDEAEILECRLWEYSSVTWGANPRTPTLSVKGLTGKDDESVITTDLELQKQNASRALNTGISDRLCKSIEAWMQSIDQPHQGNLVPDQQLADDLGAMVILSQIVNLNRSIETWKR